MKTRFEGESGAKLLRLALRDQLVLGCSDDLIEAVAQDLKIEELPPGTILSEQGSAEADVYFILMGTGIEVLIDGRAVAARNSKEIVGEMATIEPGGLRSATLRAAEGVPTVVGRLEAARFANLCDEYPSILYRGIARVVADRLRERSKFIRPRGARPTVFIGSSKEGLDVAEAIRSGLAYAPATIVLWSDDGSVFIPSSTPIEDLTAALEKFDFAVFVLSPDDLVKQQGPGRDPTEMCVPRDNVLFEFGLFIGALGRERVYGVTPRSKNVRVPTDLAGVILVPYDDQNPPLSSALGPVCTTLRDLIQTHGPR